MSIFEALILGLVQGLTEFIPVSSSGHLLILHELFGTSENTLAFDVALHVGTLLALLIYFRRDLVEFARNALAKNEQGRIARLLILATLPAALAGLLFSGYIDDNFRTPFVVATTLFFVGLLMLVVDGLTVKKSKSSITTKQGLLLGCAQAFALIPGVSRSGATITAGLALGMDRASAARFSFLLAIPIVAGSALGVLLKDTPGVSSGNWVLFAGVLSAFISGLVAIKFLLSVIAKVGLRPFAIYRIVLAVVVLFAFV